MRVNDAVTEMIVIAFAVTNSTRVVAYNPQIARLFRDRSGAAAISWRTWMLFIISHIAPAAYAGVVLCEKRACLVFTVKRNLQRGRLRADVV